MTDGSAEAEQDSQRESEQVRYGASGSSGKAQWAEESVRPKWLENQRVFNPVAPPPFVRPEVWCRTPRATDSRSGTRVIWAVHPGGPGIPGRVGWALDFDVGNLETSRAALADHRNCSSATILVILEQLRGRPMVSGTSVVAIGVGSGLTAAVMLFRSG